MSAMRNSSLLLMSSNETMVNRAVIVKDMLDILNFRFLIYGCLILPLALLGIILNGFTMLVLLHPRMRAFSTNAYLTTLSFANIGCLASYLFLHSLRYLLSYDSFKLGIYSWAEVTSYESFINFVYGIWTPVLATFQLFAIYLTCAVTVDRWIYVTWPLKADKICTMRNTFVAILALLLFCLVYNVPRWFEIHAIQKLSPNTNRTYYQATLTDLAKHPVYALIMQRYAYFIFVYGLPFFILIVANICIALKLIEAKRRKKRLLGGGGNNNSSVTSKSMHSTIRNGGGSSAHKSLLANQTPTDTDINNNQIQMESVAATGSSTVGGAKSTRQTKSNSASSSTIGKSLNSVATVNRKSNGRKLDTRVTAMVIAVVVVFFICQFPYLIVNILAYKYQRHKWFQFSKAVCDFLAVLNCCLNFIIYCLFGQKFREIAKNILLHPTRNPYKAKHGHRHQSTMHSQFQSRTEQTKSMLLRSNVGVGGGKSGAVNSEEAI